MKDRHLQAKAGALEAVAKLDRAVAHMDAEPAAADRWVRLDAVAKRFEVAFEYVWKAFKAASEWQGTEAPGPRPAIQAALQYAWIDEPEAWVAFLDARNTGAHEYLGLPAEEYAAVARRFAASARAAIARLP